MAVQWRRMQTLAHYKRQVGKTIDFSDFFFPIFGYIRLMTNKLR